MADERPLEEIARHLEEAEQKLDEQLDRLEEKQKEMENRSSIPDSILARAEDDEEGQ